MTKDVSDIWRWNNQLSWELFSEAIYCYRQTMKSFPQHKTHMFCKNGLFAIITAVEAYANQTLLQKPYNWSKSQLDNKQHTLEYKIKKLTNDSIDLANFKESKKIRNDFLVHHKRKDHRYVIEINPFSLLDAIESAQEIIAKIAFYNDLKFPYWISGVNFIDPRTKDIDLFNEVEYWRYIKNGGLINKFPNDFLTPSGSLNYPNLWDNYKILYDGLWQILKNKNFEMYLGEHVSCQYWD